MELRLQDLVYISDQFVNKRLNKKQRHDKRFLETIFVRIEEEMGVPRFVFGTYDQEGFWQAIDSAKINVYEVPGIKDVIKEKLFK